VYEVFYVMLCYVMPGGGAHWRLRRDGFFYFLPKPRLFLCSEEFFARKKWQMERFVLLLCTQLINTSVVKTSIKKYISGVSGPEYVSKLNSLLKMSCYYVIKSPNFEVFFI
jgi:hypothetical protein